MKKYKLTGERLKRKIKRELKSGIYTVTAYDEEKRMWTISRVGEPPAYKEYSWSVDPEARVVYIPVRDILR